MNENIKLDQLALALASDFSDLKFQEAQRIANAIRREIRAIVNEERSGENVWIPAQPAEPRFAVGTRVLISKRHHLRPGGKGTVIELRPEIGAVDVELDDTETNLLFPVGRLEPLPAEPAALLSQDVLDLSPEEYEAYSMSKNIAIHERRFSKTAGFTPPYIIDALLNKGLIEQIGTGRETTYRAVVAQPAPVAALPEGVTREHDWMLSELRLNCRLSDDNVVFYHTAKDNLSILTNVSDPAAAVGLRKSDVTRLRDYLNSVLEVME